METALLSVTGSWGSETIPADLLPRDAYDAGLLFARLMSGETEPADLLMQDYGVGLLPVHKAALRMLVERARRCPGHAEVAEDPDRYNLRTFLTERIDREFGKTVSAQEAYAEYERWALSGPLPVYPAERRRFLRAMSAHFVSVLTADGLYFRGAALVTDASALGSAPGTAAAAGAA